MADTKKPSKSLFLTNAKLLFRNFAGRERPFNSEGDRNFSVLLDPEMAQQLTAEEWRVKQLNPREGEEVGDYHLKVKVNYGKGRPPRVVLITSSGRTDLGADEVEILDAAVIKRTDVKINGWWSDMAGGGYSGYLEKIFVTIEEDEIDLMYANVQEANPIARQEAEMDPDELARAIASTTKRVNELGED